MVQHYCVKAIQRVKAVQHSNITALVHWLAA
jgi:hypothetical protein